MGLGSSRKFVVSTPSNAIPTPASYDIATPDPSQVCASHFSSLPSNIGLTLYELPQLLQKKNHD